MPGYTKKELANFAGYTYRRLYDIDNAMPESEKLFVPTEGGKYDLAMFVQRWTAYCIRKAAKDSESGNDLDSVRAEHEKVKMEKTEIQLALMRNEVVKTVDVQALWVEITSMIRQRFMTLSDRLAPRLVMVADAELVKEIIDRDVRDSLMVLSEDAPLPDAHTDVDKEDDEEG